MQEEMPMLFYTVAAFSRTAEKPQCSPSDTTMTLLINVSQQEQNPSRVFWHEKFRFFQTDDNVTSVLKNATASPELQSLQGIHTLMWLLFLFLWMDPCFYTNNISTNDAMEIDEYTWRHEYR